MTLWPWWVLSLYVSLCVSVYFCLSACLPVCLSVCLSVCLPVCLAGVRFTKYRKICPKIIVSKMSCKSVISSPLMIYIYIYTISQFQTEVHLDNYFTYIFTWYLWFSADHVTNIDQDHKVFVATDNSLCQLFHCSAINLLDDIRSDL